MKNKKLSLNDFRIFLKVHQSEGIELYIIFNWHQKPLEFHYDNLHRGRKQQ